MPHEAELFWPYQSVSLPLTSSWIWPTGSTSRWSEVSGGWIKIKVYNFLDPSLWGHCRLTGPLGWRPELWSTGLSAQSILSSCLITTSSSCLSVLCGYGSSVMQTRELSLVCGFPTPCAIEPCHLLPAEALTGTSYSLPTKKRSHLPTSSVITWSTHTYFSSVLPRLLGKMHQVHASFISQGQSKAFPACLSRNVLRIRWM